MAEKKGITMMQLLKFYRDKDIYSCPNTINYIMNSSEAIGSNDYIAMAETFKELESMKFSSMGKWKKEDVCFYLYLKSLKENYGYVFEGEKEKLEICINLFRPYIKINNKDFIDPKWHFFVAFFMLLDVTYNKPWIKEIMTGKEIGFNPKKSKKYANLEKPMQSLPLCGKKNNKRLKMWMAEAAGINIVDNEGDIVIDEIDDWMIIERILRWEERNGNNSNYVKDKRK